MFELCYSTHPQHASYDEHGRSNIFKARMLPDNATTDGDKDDNDDNDAPSDIPTPSNTNTNNSDAIKSDVVPLPPPLPPSLTRHISMNVRDYSDKSMINMLAMMEDRPLVIRLIIIGLLRDQRSTFHDDGYQFGRGLFDDPIIRIMNHINSRECLQTWSINTVQSILTDIVIADSPICLECYHPH
jgi:hypothetical protein